MPAPLRAPLEYRAAEEVRAALIRRVVVATVVSIVPVMIFGATLFPDVALRAALVGTAIVALAVAAVVLVRVRRVPAAAIVFVGGFALMINVMAFRSGGLHAPVFAGNLPLILIAGVLFRERVGVMMAVLVGIVGASFAYVERIGALPDPVVVHTPFSRWFAYLAVAGLTVALQRFTVRAAAEGLEAARRELDERRTSERLREGLVADLNERLKELRLLHQAAHLLQSTRPFDRALLDDMVRLIPEAMLHPSEAVARIRYGDVQVASPSWRETPWMLSRSLEGGGELHVAYLSERPPADIGPFLNEERDLLASLAEMLDKHFAHHLVEERRRQLEGQLRQSQKLQALGTLAGGIAHDFNNVLTAIRANAELGLDELEGSHPARDSLREIASAGERATDLIRRILLFSRKEETTFVRTDVGRLVHDALTLLRVSVPPNVTVRVTASEDLPPVLGDATQLHQVLMNLGTNALHAMADTGGTLTISATLATEAISSGGPGADTAIDAGLRSALEAGPLVRIVVRDEGCGMSPEVLERMFDPFFTTKPQERGTGLGLSVVHGIVESHHGLVRVTSTVDVGTTFELFLPAADGVAADSAAAPLPFSGHGERLLYVDDDESLVLVISRVLERLNYRVTGFQDPTTALQAFREQPRAFDAVVTDGQMPRMTGLALAQAIRRIRPEIPIAVTSGDRLDPAELAAVGITHQIPKPYSMQEFSQALRDLLDS